MKPLSVEVPCLLLFQIQIQAVQYTDSYLLLYSNLNPVAVISLLVWKWKKSWLLEDIWLGGRESPQYGFPNMGDVFEPPS